MAQLQRQRSSRRAQKKDGARDQMKKVHVPQRITQEESAKSPAYDPDWAICPDGGSNNKLDYQRHFPTCNGYKCLFSCDSAWHCYDGFSQEMNFSYEMTVRQDGVSDEDLSIAILEMEERLLVKMSEKCGIDDCICKTINSNFRRHLRENKTKQGEVEVHNRRKDRSMMEATCEAPDGQKIVNLSNLRRDEIVQGGVCQSIQEVPEGERCLKMIGRLEFVHLTDPNIRRQLEDYYEAALSELNYAINEGMAKGDFLAPAEDPNPIITGMQFVSEVEITEGTAGVGGPGTGSNWGTTGGDGQENDHQGSAGEESDGQQNGNGQGSIEKDGNGQGLSGPTEGGSLIPGGNGQGSDVPGAAGQGNGMGGKEDDSILVIDVPLSGPNAAKSGNRQISYGVVGMVVALVVVALFVIGLYLRRRQKNKDNSEGVEVEDNLSLSSGEASAETPKEDGSFPTAKAKSYDLGSVTEDTLPADASEEVGVERDASLADARAGLEEISEKQG